MNEFLLRSPNSTNPRILLTSASWLLDTGAEFAKFSMEAPPRIKPIPVWMTKYTNSTDLVDGKLKFNLKFSYADSPL